MEVSGGGAAVVRVPPRGADAAADEAAADALAEAGRLLSSGRSVVVTLDPHAEADVGTVGALARLLLTARRGGAVLVVQAPDAALRQLAELMGLRDVLGLGDVLQASGTPTGPAGAKDKGA